MRTKLTLFLFVLSMHLTHALRAGEEVSPGIIFPLEARHEYEGLLDHRLTGEMKSFIYDSRGDASMGCSSCGGS